MINNLWKEWGRDCSTRSREGVGDSGDELKPYKLGVCLDLLKRYAGKEYRDVWTVPTETQGTSVPRCLRTCRESSVYHVLVTRMSSTVAYKRLTYSYTYLPED